MELVGVAEIALLLGVTKQAVANWRNRKGGFPSPAANLKAGPVWTLESIQKWAEAEGYEIQVDAAADGAATAAPAKQAVIMAVMNMKGGVGKSTVASNFGWYAAYLKNLKVLLVDLDPQFNLSQYILGAEGYEQLIEKGLPTVDAMFQPLQGQPPVQVNKLIRKVKTWDDGSCLHLIPASLDLAWTMRLALERSHVLRDQLDDVRSDYDLIIIDCAPTESILSTATYHAADWILVPVKPEFLATIGMPLLLKSLREFKRTYPNEDAPEVAGILFNDVSDRVEHTRSRQRVRKEAADLKLHVFNAELNHSDSYPTGARRGQPIFMTDNARTERKSELTRVGNEILERVGL